MIVTDQPSVVSKEDCWSLGGNVDSCVKIHV